MSDRLHEVAQHIADYGLDADSWFALREVAAESLEDTGTHHVIRTPEELEAIDPNAVVISSENEEVYYVKNLTERHTKTFLYVPAVVIATGTQVRAAREAMEQENG